MADAKTTAGGQKGSLKLELGKIGKMRLVWNL